MSLTMGYLLAELLVEGEQAASAIAPSLEERVKQQRAALAGLTTKQRAATLVAALRATHVEGPSGALSIKVWQRLCEPTLRRDARAKRELEELRRD